VHLWSSAGSLNTWAYLLMALKWKEEHNHKGHPRVLRKEKASSSCISVYTSSCDPKGSSEPGQDETAVPIYERHAKLIVFFCSVQQKLDIILQLDMSIH